MRDLYVRLLDLLGHSDQHEAFGNFLRYLAETAGVTEFDELHDGNSCVRTFKTLGFIVRYDKREHKFDMVNLETVDTQDIQAFTGDLPGGITQSDGPDEVEQKLGMTALTHEELTGDSESTTPVVAYHFKLPPHIVSVFFDPADRKISGLQVHYDEELSGTNKNPRPHGK
jgi:hypothetical protein